MGEHQREVSDSVGLSDEVEMDLSKRGPTQRSWTEQWDRVLRWYKDVRRTYEGTEGEGTERLRDFTLAFFQSAFHLKDWLDKSVPADASKGEETADHFLHNDATAEALRWCRDVANASKHLKLNDSAQARDTDMSRTDVNIHVGPGGLVRHRFTITGTIDGQLVERDALELADACLDAWRTFLGRRGLG